MNPDSLIRDLYAIKNTLEDQFPGRKFSLDGHLVGSVGEVLVAEAYGIELYPNGTETHDGKATDGREVQIKATQIDRVSISSEPEHLIVIKIHQDGTWEEIYNGPGSPVWNRAGKKQKNGQRQITISALRELMIGVTEAQRIPKIENISDRF